MVYGRRSTYRRKGRRGNRSLSTRRIFNNKSAKAQAAQIYALRKSVNRVRRQCRPEVKEVNTSFSMRELGTTTSAATLTDFTNVVPMPTVGTGDNNRIGDLIKILPTKLRFALQYREVYNTVQGSTVWNVPDLVSHGMQVRVIAIQAKASSDVVPTLTDILESYSTNTDSVTTISHMVQQFKNGITARYNILMNRVYNISQDKPTVSRTLSIKPKIRSVKWEAGLQYPRGQIFVYFIQGGSVARAITAESGTLYDYSSVDVMFKFSQPYTDA